MTIPDFQILPYPTEDAPGVPLADRRQVHQCHVCREYPAEPLIASKYPNQGINFVCRPCLEAALKALYEYKGDKPRYSYDMDSGEVKLDPQGIPQRDPAHEQQAPCARRGCGHPYERHFDPYWGDLEVGCKYCGHYKCTEFVEPKS